MHPLVARIHPSIRTGVIAWLMSRLILWTAVLAGGATPWPPLGEGAFGRGAPFWVALVEGVRRITEVAPPSLAVGATTTLAVLGELALLAGAIAVYRFARRDDLPHTAERATWLWLAVPAAALTLPVSAWSFAAGAAAIAVASVRGQRWVAGSIALVAGIGFRPEVMLLWPGTTWMAWRVYKSGKHPGWGPLAVSLSPLVAFTALIGGAMALAGRWGISVRTLAPDTAWRAEWAWQGVAAQAPLLLVALGALLVLGLMLRAFKDIPGAWFALALPALMWPILHDPVLPSAGALFLALPAYVILARALDDRALERPVLVAFLAGLLLCV